MGTRFAPSMTGYLHQGHLYHLITLYALARQSALPVSLRVEDHDIARSRPAYEEALFADLAAFGVSWEGEVVYQRDRMAYYSERLASLKAAGRVYGCACTRRELRAGCAQGKEAVYPGHCADKNLPLEGHAVRFRVLSDEQRFIDERLGEQVQAPATQCGDFVLRDRTGQYSYHFAAVCDDIREGTSLVVRGEDLLAATGRQLQLYQAFKATPPRYFHHALVTDGEGKKLSKRTLATSLRHQIESGRSVEEIIAAVLQLEQPCSFQEAVERTSTG